MDEAAMVELLQALGDEPPSETLRVCVGLVKGLAMFLGFTEEQVAQEMTRVHPVMCEAMLRAAKGGPCAVLRDLGALAWLAAAVLERAETVEALMVAAQAPERHRAN